MLKYKKINLSFALTLFASMIFAYSYAARYTEFFLKSNKDKLILLCELWVLFIFVCLVLITPPTRWLLTGIKKNFAQKLLLFSALISAAMIVFLIDLPPFPKKLELAIRPEKVISEGIPSEITLVSITRIDPPWNIPEPVRLVNLGYEDGWEVANHYLVSSSSKEGSGSLHYNSFIQGELRVGFITGPGQGSVEIIKNGEGETIDLHDSAYGTIEKTISIDNSWKNADFIRRIMLIGVMGTDFLSITTLLFFIFLGINQLLINRMLKTRGLISLTLLIILSTGMGVVAKQIQRVVTFSDAALEAGVRSAISKPDGEIYSHEVLTIIELDLSGRNVTNLDGIEGLHNLRVLNLAYNKVPNFRSLEKLKKLQRLDLRGCQLTSLSQLPILPKLEELTLRENSIEDVRILEKFSKLRTLDLGQNRIADVNPLRGLTHLKKLDLRQNQITDISPLEELTDLRYLNLNSNFGLSDISPIKRLTRLESLMLRDVPIRDQVSYITHLVHLRHLNLRNTGIKSTEPLVELLSTGALQDDEKNGIRAQLNILENNFDSPEQDPLNKLRFYWHNITYRYPYSLPEVVTDTEPPIFSHSSGFYNGGILLELFTKAPGGKIFYTIDGSEPSLSPQHRPTGSTRQYSSPILIQSRTNELNSYANIETSKINTFTPPNDIFKATVIRAIVLNTDGRLSSISTNVFFIDEDINSRFKLPIISIASQPEGLFSEEMGIYVPGDLYEDKFTDRRWNPANYTQTGEIWERPANIQLFDKNGTLLLDQQVGIRLHGGASRAYSQKSLRILADGGNEESNYIYLDLFPNLRTRFSTQPVTSFESLILRTGGGGDWDNTMIRDVIGQGLLEGTRLDIQGNYPVLVFINGEYWGIHNLRTRYDAHYFESNYGISAENLVICQKGSASLYFGEPGDEVEYQELLKLIDPDPRAHRYATVNTLSIPEKFIEISAQMDIDNYIDYYISQIYVHKADWPSGNILFWKMKNNSFEQDTPVKYGHDGKWRWMVIDMDLGLYNPQGNTLELATEEGLRETYLFRSLLQNRLFTISFVNRFADMLNSFFKEEVVLDKISEIEEQYAPEVPDHIKRWGTFGGSVNSWHATIDGMRYFASVRPDIQRQQLVDYFSLAGTTRLTVLSDPTKGYVRVNSIDITKNTPGVEDPANWTGIYFQGVPITITAVPAEGYRFSHWEGLPEGDALNMDLELTLTGDITIQAIFSKVP